MYKIMTKLHTTRENVFAFHMVTNDKGETVEYSVTTLEEAADKALELLERIGYADLRIADDQSYYLDLIYGTKPVPEVKTYTVEIICPTGVTATPDLFTEVAENSTVRTQIDFEMPVKSFHLIIDGEEQKAGLPEWIEYNEISLLQGILTFTGITQDHIIEIVVDEEIIYSI